MTNPALTETKPRSVTYMGVPAEVHEIRKAGAMGERVTITRWLAKAVGQPVEYAPFSVVARHHKGDGRKMSYQMFSERVFEGGAQYAMRSAQAWAEDQLS